MAEEKENPIEEVSSTPEQPTGEQPRNEKGQFVSKFESAKDDSVAKVDLTKPPSQEAEEVKEQPTENVEAVEEQKEEIIEEELPVIEEVTVEDLQDEPEEIIATEQVVEEAIVKAKETGEPLPEQLKKVVQFMNETGGDLQDYVNLNRNIEKMDDSEVLDEYYRTTKSHLTSEERGFLLEDSFGINEEVDDERTARMKKIALKEQVAEARAHLDRQKSKYYEEIKAGSKLTQEQQQAINFFNRYNKESEKNKQISQAKKETFLKKTNNVFNEDFKGFDYQVGDKRFRYNIKDVGETKNILSDPKNFINKFVNEKEEMHDPSGYHKSLYTAMNADAVAKHFYEQGKADAVKNQVAKDKNIDMNPRQTHSEMNVGGMKVRVLGQSADEIKNRSFKIRKKS